MINIRIKDLTEFSWILRGFLTTFTHNATPGARCYWSAAHDTCLGMIDEALRAGEITDYESNKLKLELINVIRDGNGLKPLDALKTPID